MFVVPFSRLARWEERGAYDFRVVPSHKVLKSVVRSVADQFTSLMNYADDDYVMGHLLTAARSSGERTLSVDLLTGEAEPPALLVPPVSRSVVRHAKGFPELVHRSGSTVDFVKKAKMTIAFDTAVERPRCVGSDLVESPYECRVSIVDDRGKEFAVSLSGWWYPEAPVKPKSRTGGIRHFFRLLKGGRI